MKGRLILDLDMRDSLESNLQFLKDCEKYIEMRRKRLLDLHKKPTKNKNKNKNER